MPDTDGVLAAIDACLYDSLSPDAMRWAPDEPDPTPEDGLVLWGQYVNGDSVYRTTMPPYRFHTVPGDPPSLQGATPSVTIVDEATVGWPIIRDRGDASSDYIVSDGVQEWVMPPVPQRQDGVRMYWGTAPANGEQPQWRPLDSEIVSDVTFVRDESNEWAERLLSMPRTVSVTLTADTSSFRRGFLDALCVAYSLRWGRQDRMHALKSEYNRRRRRRNRRG